MKPILEIQHLSKKYSINKGKEPYLSLRDSLSGLFKPKQRSEDFWALQDICFDIYPGESIGVIGKNGAGKSTLLKILSKITPPTSGKVITRGRIASLLEVGTGFHPELTGRENIYLNGSILGLRQREISKHFDAIVDFSGIEKFIDTPLKRYSSGMQLRLAFAVAAHLEPEILIIDEVLAVGDSEFQKKCLGKMGEVSRSGRTILFVSHNMAAIQSLTTKSILLNKGRLLSVNDTANIIQQYTTLITTDRSASSFQIETKGQYSRIMNITMKGEDNLPSGVYTIGSLMRFEVALEIYGHNSLSLELFLVDQKGMRIGLASTYQFHEVKLPKDAGIYHIELVLDPIHLASGNYKVEIATSVINSHWDHYVENAYEFEVLYCNPLDHTWDFKQEYAYGSLALLLRNSPIIKQTSIS